MALDDIFYTISDVRKFVDSAMGISEDEAVDEYLAEAQLALEELDKMLEKFEVEHNES